MYILEILFKLEHQILCAHSKSHMPKWKFSIKKLGVFPFLFNLFEMEETEGVLNHSFLRIFHGRHCVNFK